MVKTVFIITCIWDNQQLAVHLILFHFYLYVCVLVCVRPHHLADVVPPGQKQDASVIFLPVRQNEREQHHPQDVI